MIQLLVSAPNSGCGKTTVACALLAALKARGLDACAFKCGPDYIDPMFHRAVLGVESHNLDLFFSSAGAVRGFYAHSAARHSATVCEGAMGFYDGLGGVSDTASAWHLASVLNLPVLLVLRPKGVSLTLAAEVRGLLRYRSPSRIGAILLNDCSERLYDLLAPMLQKETGLPVVGYLPHLPAAGLPSRHLGLYTAAEVDDLQHKIALLSAALQANMDWAKFEQVFNAPAPAAPAACRAVPPRAKIAVARDEAFCFTYAETLEAFEHSGAQIEFFSPIHGSALPAGAGGLYLPGGYPELWAKELAQNTQMLAAVKNAAGAGMPIVAECGGLLYLSQSLEDTGGKVWPMAGVLPGSGRKVGRLLRFGYAQLAASEDSLLMRTGEQWPAHEFHHWDSTAPGAALKATKPISAASWSCCYTNAHLYAGFPHLYWAGTPLPGRFVSAAQKYTEGAKL